MGTQRVKLTIADKIGRITFTNGENYNAMDDQFCKEFSDAALACETSPTVKVILIEAEGEMFSVGGDINNFVGNKHRIHEHILDMATQIHIGISSLRRAGAPVIAAVNGMAAGGAFSLICGVDVVIAKRSAKFNPAFTKSGLTPDAGGTYYFPRLVGFRKAFHIMATNPTLTADQAFDLGIVSQVVDDSAFKDVVETLVRSFVNSAPGALAGLKALFRSSAVATLDEQLNNEARSISALAATPATMERLIAFVAKTK